MDDHRDSDSDSAADVVVVGGGASGVLLASRLLGAGGAARIVIVDRTGAFGRGLAYGAADPGHLMNVRVRNLSARSDAPDDLERWCAARGMRFGLDDFLPRRVFGDYLADHLDCSEVASTAVLGRVADDVVSVTPDDRGFVVRLASGRTLRAGAVVLALGNRAPAIPWFAAALGGHAAWVGDPWEPGALDRIAAARRPLLVGTGLTAIDVALVVARAGTAPIEAISRHGLVPCTHRADRSACPPVPEELTGATALTASRLVRVVREAVAVREAGGRSWQDLIDGLRPVTNVTWAGLADDDRRRIARWLPTFWSVHRHRTAPSVGARVDGLRSSGRLQVWAGSIVGAQARGEELVVTMRIRGATTTVTTDCLVNCTGPDPDWCRRGGSLTVGLARGGWIRPDPLGLGLDTTADGQLVGRDGRVTPGLFTLGPPRRGRLWESTAIPEIRVQAEALARTLGGDGGSDTTAV